MGETVILKAKQNNRQTNKKEGVNGEGTMYIIYFNSNLPTEYSVWMIGENGAKSAKKQTSKQKVLLMLGTHRSQQQFYMWHATTRFLK